LLRVDFSGVGTDKNLAELTTILKNSTLPIELNFKGCSRLTDASFQKLGELAGIQILRLEDVKISDKSLPELAKLEQLDTLSLKSDQITNDGLPPLSNLKRLEELTLLSRQVTTAGLVHLKGLTNLRILIANTAGLRDDEMA